ncbi:MAG TPA: AAA family ATPase [Streptosporangiaceae bacterium]|jgi:DNA-binding NarL/FixJ family response regulator/DNA-binding MarR family transcriptional regulator|nr:AAA family ATPase [Streptosporangiaceae bacterium]
MLVNRDEEIATLNALLHDCTQGSGSVAVIRGPVASGKTTLLRAFTEQAESYGATILGAVASRAERGLPLGILDQLFRGNGLPAAITRQGAELIESRPALARSAAEPEPEAITPVAACLFEGLLKLLVGLAEDYPVVVAVDDLQYADVTSLQCLSYLARRASASRIFIVLAEGTQVLPADQLLHAEILRQGNCHSIPLALLPPSSMASLLRQHFNGQSQQLASSCHIMTGGNPLLANALVQDARTLPDTTKGKLVPSGAFRSAIVTCLHRYEPWMVELAQALAILDSSATVWLLAELLDISPGAAAQGIDALSASGLFEAGRFRHEAARRAVLDSMTAEERAIMHGRAARALYLVGSPAAALAGHLVAAERIGASWVVPVLQAAAEQALADSDPDRATGYLRRAEVECIDERQRATIRFALASAEWHTDPECAGRHLSGLAADAKAGLLDSECLTELVFYLLWIGDAHNAGEVLAGLDGTRPRVAPVPPPGFLGWLTTIRSPLNFLYPDLARRPRHPGQGVRRVPPGPGRHRQQAARPQSPGMDTDAAATLASAEKVLQEHGLNSPALASITTALMALICEDMLDRAAFWCNVLLRESEAPHAGRLWRGVLTGICALIETRRGNLPAAEEHASNALAMLSKKAWGVGIGGPLASLLFTTTANRKHEDAAAYLRMPVTDAMFGTVYGLLYLCARGDYYLTTGRAQAALADFTGCGDRMIAWGLDHPGLVPWRAKAAEAHLLLGNASKARALAAEQLAQVGTRSPRTRGIALRVLALTSHPSKRTALLRDSAEALRDSGARLELAYTFTELSNAHVALGEIGRARWAARQAQNLADRCGAGTLKNKLIKTDTDQREVDDEVDKAQLTRLSEAERRVARLAAYGHTNCQIAGKLFITVSTVEQHLTRVYRKLGVTCRVDLPIEI